VTGGACPRPAACPSRVPRRPHPPRQPRRDGPDPGRRPPANSIGGPSMSPQQQRWSTDVVWPTPAGRALRQQRRAMPAPGPEVRGTAGVRSARAVRSIRVSGTYSRRPGSGRCGALSSCRSPGISWRVALTVLVHDQTRSALLAAVAYAASMVPVFLGGIRGWRSTTAWCWPPSRAPIRPSRCGLSSWDRRRQSHEYRGRCAARPFRGLITPRRRRIELRRSLPNTRSGCRSTPRWP
jgi:hypothetical protein